MNESRKYVNIHEMPITVYVPINAWAKSKAIPIPYNQIGKYIL